MSTPDDPAAAPESSRLQKWFQSVVTHPDGIESGADSEAAQKLISLRPGELEKVITRSKALTAAERLAIYANAYHTRLLECLGEIFPMLKRTLGEEAFDGLAFGYLQKYPSQSYTLNDLGRHFSRFLEETKPEPGSDLDPASAAKQDEGLIKLSDDWPDFMIDLARLEWAIYEVFDGEGVEGKPLLQTDQLLGIPQEQTPLMRLQTVPCLHLLATRFPVNDYFTAIRTAPENEGVDIPAAQDSYVALTRRDYVVRRYNLSPTEYELLKSIQEGDSFGGAIERAVAIPGNDVESLAANLQLWFRNWTAEGFFQSVRLD
ncbi:hypothetical protein GC207_10165 [bacterium]|nr:hypothetical protein [bacterium]